MTPTSVSDQQPLRSYLLNAGRTHGASFLSSLEERISVLEASADGRPIRILNLSSNPVREMDVIAQMAGGARVEHVCTINSKYLSDTQDPAVHYSNTFDSAFWEEIALDFEPDFVLSDGTLSDWHQVAMLKLIFPAIGSAGSLVFYQSSRKVDTDNDRLVKFVGFLAKSQMGQDKNVIESGDATGYLLRNISAISYTGKCIVLKKREFEQRRLKAVPFAVLANDHEVLDRPGAYPRIEARIYGSDHIKSRHAAVVTECADVIAPPAERGRIDGALISGGGIVHTHDGYIVEESFINTRHSSRRGPFYRIGSSDDYVSEKPLEPVRRVPGRNVLMKQTWDANYGHWIVDTLPRMRHYAKGNVSESGVLVNGSISDALQQMQASSLELFGIVPSQLRPIDWQTTEVDELVYVTPSSIPPMIKSPLSINTLSALADRVEPAILRKYDDYRRIYLTRNSYSRRKLVNEDALLPILLSAGYRVVIPEALSFPDQVALFSRASHVVGNMGAAFSNLAFSPHGVKVFMLATQRMQHDYFYDLVCHKHGEYYALQGKSVDSSDLGIGADFVIDDKDFLRVFHEFDGPAISDPIANQVDL